MIFFIKILCRRWRMMSKGGKNKWALFVMALAGIVAGGYIGMFAGGLPYMAWLNYGADFGIDPPFAVNLGIVALSVGFNIKFTIAGVVGMLIAALIYRRL